MEDFGIEILQEGDSLRIFLISKWIIIAFSLDFPENVDHQEEKFNLQECLIIKGARVPDPFSIPENQFANISNNVPPFGIKDIFNFLIFKSSDYNRKKIALYKAFKEYSLFQDWYVEEL